jgi:hypothetical protein
MSQRKEINVDVKIRQPGEQPVCFETGTVYFSRALRFNPGSLVVSVIVHPR